MSIDKKSLSERDICTKYITPAVKQAGWDEITQIREEVGFNKGRIVAGIGAHGHLVPGSCGRQLAQLGYNFRRTL
jgi:type I site-specific restriction endonuclease